MSGTVNILRKVLSNKQKRFLKMKKKIKNQTKKWEEE